MIGLLFLSEFEDRPDDELNAIAEYMVNHKTVQAVTIDPENITFTVWLTLPFYLE